MIARSTRTATPLRPERGKPARKRASVLRTKPVRDEAYKAYIRRFPCIGCWAVNYRHWLRGDKDTYVDRLRRVGAESFAMHTGPHGVSQKASDHTCLPGCFKHHYELDHQIGKAFWKKYGLNREKLVAALRARYESERA